MTFGSGFTSGNGGGGGDVGGAATAQPVVDEFGVLDVDDDAIVTSFATSTSPVTKSGAGLNGEIGGAAMDPPRGITVKNTVSAGAYNTTDPMTFTGTDVNGDPQTATLTWTDPDGGQTLETAKTFRTVTSEAYPAMLTTGGAIRSGVGTRVGLRNPPVEGASGASYVDARIGGLLDLGGAATVLPIVSSPPHGAIDFGAAMDGGTVLGATYAEDLS